MEMTAASGKLDYYGTIRRSILPDSDRLGEGAVFQNGELCIKLESSGGNRLAAAMQGSACKSRLFRDISKVRQPPIFFWHDVCNSNRP